MRLRRRKIRPVEGTPYGVVETKSEHRVFVWRTTPTVRLVRDGQRWYREEEMIGRWDFVASQPKEPR